MGTIQNLSKVQRNTVSIALLGVGLGGVLEGSFTLFLFFFLCAGIISWTTAKFLIVAYMKLKFPEQYLDENIKKTLNEERNDNIKKMFKEEQSKKTELFK